ncbi:MAG: hypothetical protein AAGB31_03740 [Bdellovibrio sp.]
MIRFACFYLLVFFGSIVFAQIDYAGTAAQRKLQYVVVISCSVDKKTDTCISHQEDLYKKIGCALDKLNCEVEDSERSISENGHMICRYNSNCLESKNNKSCDAGFSSRWLDGANSRAICVEAPKVPNKKGAKGNADAVQ